jgi:hypothetical protein
MGIDAPTTVTILALIRLTKLKNGLSTREVPLTRHELISLLSWPNKGQSYDRIAQSLHRRSSPTRATTPPAASSNSSPPTSATRTRGPPTPRPSTGFSAGAKTASYRCSTSRRWPLPPTSNRTPDRPHRQAAPCRHPHAVRLAGDHKDHLYFYSSNAWTLHQDGRECSSTKSDIPGFPKRHFLSPPVQRLQRGAWAQLKFTANKVLATVFIGATTPTRERSRRSCNPPSTSWREKASYSRSAATSGISRRAKPGRCVSSSSPLPWPGQRRRPPPRSIIAGQ